mgnify:CR=1 FL=1
MGCYVSYIGQRIVFAAECYCDMTDDGGKCDECETVHDCDFLMCPHCHTDYVECPCPGPNSEMEQE